MRTEKRKQKQSSTGLNRRDPARIQSEEKMPELRPALANLPAAFKSTEYEGWPFEVVKSFQLRRYQKTQAERLAVLGQIDQIQKRCLAIARNERDWQHFAQEDRLRAKRLDLDELRLDMEMEELLARRISARKPVVEIKPAPRPDPVQECITRLRNRLMSGVGARAECNRLKQEFPEYATEIEREFTKMISDLREDS